MTDPLQEHPDSVNGRVAAGDDGEPTEAELFPVGSVEGDSVTPQTLVKRGLPVEVTVALMMAEVPTKTGLLDPNKSGRVLVSYVPANVVDVPVRDNAATSADRYSVKSWKLRQFLRPTFVADANDEAIVARNAFAALLATKPAAAGALLTELREMAEAELGAPA